MVGLILGVVAMELFPQIIIGSSSTSRWEHLLSIGVGFLLAIALINALNEVIKRFEDRSDLISCSPPSHHQ